MLGTLELTDCWETPAHGLKCDIPDEIGNIITGTVNITISFNGYDYVASSNSSVELYDFEVSVDDSDDDEYDVASSDSLSGSYNTGTTFTLVVGLSGAEILDISGVLLYFVDEDGSDYIDEDTNVLTPVDSKVVSGSYNFEFTVPSQKGLAACDSTSSTSYFCPYYVDGVKYWPDDYPNDNGTCKNILNATCPYDTTLNCDYCRDTALYPCYRSSPSGTGRCYSQSGVWTNTGVGHKYLYLTFDSTFYKSVGSFYFYDILNVVTSIPSPLLGQSVEVGTDENTEIVITEGDFQAEMEPLIKFIGDKSYNFTGTTEFAENELLEDLGNVDTDTDPPILSQSVRMQSIYLKDELNDAEFAGVSSIEEISLAYYDSPAANLFDFRLKYALVNESEFNTDEQDNSTSNLDGPLADSYLTLLLGPQFYSIYDITELGTGWMLFSLETPIEWDGASNILLDISYRCGYDASEGGGLSLRPRYGEYRSLVMINNQSHVVYEDAVPFLAMKSSTRKVVFDNVAIPSSTDDDDPLDSFDLSLSMNGREFIYDQLQESYASVDVVFELTTTEEDLVANLDSFKLILASALETTIPGISAENIYLISVTVSDDRRRIWEKESHNDSDSAGIRQHYFVEESWNGTGIRTEVRRYLASQTIKAEFEIVESDDVTLDSVSSEEVWNELDTQYEQGTLVADLEEIGVEVMDITSVSSFSPESSVYYEAITYITYGKNDVLAKSVSPSSGSNIGGLNVVIAGINFFDPSVYFNDSDTNTSITVKWVKSQSENYFYSDATFISSTQLSTKAPYFPESLFDDDLAPVDMELLISFNGDVYLDSGPTFKYYKQPYISDAFVVDEFGQTVKSVSQSGKYEDENGDYQQLYLYVNATYAYVRKTQLVCIFREDADIDLAQSADIGSYDSDSDIDNDVCDKGSDCLTETLAIIGAPFPHGTEFSDLSSEVGLGQVLGYTVFGCEIPALSPGDVRVTFSNNAFSNYDYAFEEDETIPIYIVSEDCDEGYYTTDPSIPCSMCPIGTYEQDRSCVSCSKNFYQDEEGQSGSCIECKKNTYTEYSSSTSVEDCLCYEGFYSPTGESGVDCVKCIDNAICPGGTDPPYPVEGYYRSFDTSEGYYLTSNQTMESCIPETACPGGSASPCRTGYSGYKCSECSDKYYRLGHYCTLCPPPILVSFTLPAQMLLYAGSLQLFSWHFDSVSKIGSFAILLRFVQTTYLMMNYELSWQGTHKGLYENTDGVLTSYNTDIYEVIFFPVFKTLSPLMPFFFFPDFTETAATDCDGYFNSETGSSDSGFFYSWIIPVVLFGYQLLKWLFLYGRSYSSSLNLMERWRKSSAVVKYSDAAEEKDEMSHDQRMKKVYPGQKELGRLLGLFVGVSVCLMPFFLRKGLRKLTCDDDTLGTACTPDSKLKMLVMVLIVMVLVGTGIIFFEDPRKDGPYKFLTKSKTSMMKKWDFYTHTRMLLLVVTTFISSSGVFQTGLALTVLLLNMFVHAFSYPFKHPRCNDLETLAFLSNISMLFLGMVGSIGALPSRMAAYYVQLFGIILFVVSFGTGIWILLYEVMDRWSLNRTKKGRPQLTFFQYVKEQFLIPEWIMSLFPKMEALKDPRVQAKDEQSLVEFTGQLMDALLPKQRDGEDPFAQLGSNNKNKKVPREEIKRLLFSRAMTKREMKKVRTALYQQWLLLTTKLIYTTTYNVNDKDDPLYEDFTDEKAVIRLKTCLNRLAKPEPQLIWYFSRRFYRLSHIFKGSFTYSHSTSALDYLNGGKEEDKESREKYVWRYLKNSNCIRDFEHDKRKKDKRKEAFLRFYAIWEKVVGNTSEFSGVVHLDSEQEKSMNSCSWFTWKNEGKVKTFQETKIPKFFGEGQKSSIRPMRLTLPTRVQVILDWYFDSTSDLRLVDSLQKATMMLGTECENMIRTTLSYAKECTNILSITRMPREGGRETATIKHGLVLNDVRACFAGDILCYRLHLKNCFGNDIPTPSKRVSWVVKLRTIMLPGDKEKKPSCVRKLIDHFKPKVTEIEVLATRQDREDGNCCILEFAIPRSLRQTAYRVDIYDLFNKINFVGDESWGKVTNGSKKIIVKSFPLVEGDSIEIEVHEDLKRVGSDGEEDDEWLELDSNAELQQTTDAEESEGGASYCEGFLVVKAEKYGNDSLQVELDREYCHDMYKKPSPPGTCGLLEPQFYARIKKVAFKANIIYIQNPIEPKGSLKPAICGGTGPNVTFTYPQSIVQNQDISGTINFVKQEQKLFVHGLILRVEIWNLTGVSHTMKQEVWDICGMINFELQESAKGTIIFDKGLRDKEYFSIQRKDNNARKKDQSITPEDSDEDTDGFEDDQKGYDEMKDEALDEMKINAETANATRHIQKGCGIELFKVSIPNELDENDDYEKQVKVCFRISSGKEYEIQKYKIKTFILGIGQDHTTIPLTKDDPHGKNGYIWCVDEFGTESPNLKEVFETKKQMKREKADAEVDSQGADCKDDDSVGTKQIALKPSAEGEEDGAKQQDIQAEKAYTTDPTKKRTNDVYSEAPMH